MVCLTRVAMFSACIKTDMNKFEKREKSEENQLISNYCSTLPEPDNCYLAGPITNNNVQIESSKCNVC